MHKMRWYPKNKDELAAFLVHVAHETDELRTLVEELNGKPIDAYDYCNWAPNVVGNKGKHYHGRGWFQLSYPPNYYYAGQAINPQDGWFLVRDPDIDVTNEVITCQTAIWFWT